MHFEKFSNENINFLLQLFENSRIIWVSLKDEYELTNYMFFSVGSAKTPIPTGWAQQFQQDGKHLFLIT